jgi:hypothetical protein
MNLYGMKLALVLIHGGALTACATMRAPDPVLPAVIEPAKAEALYEAHKLVCEAETCSQHGRSYDVTAYRRTRFDEPRYLLSRSRQIKNAVRWPLFGIGIGSGAASAYSFFFGANEERGSGAQADWMLAGGIAAGASVVAIVAGLIVTGVWKEPVEQVEEAYNEGLRTEIAGRVEASKILDRIEKASSVRP